MLTSESTEMYLLLRLSVRLENGQVPSDVPILV